MATYLEGPFKGIDLKRAACDPRYATHFMDDFVRNATLDTTNDTYLLQGDSGGTGIIHATLANAPGGVLDLATDDQTDEDGVSLQVNGVGGAWCPGGSYGVLAFEARIAPADVADCAWFVGLASEAITHDLLTDDTGAMADSDYIGFNVLDDDSDSLDLGFNLSGGTDQTETAVQALTASTYYRLGFRYDPGPDECTFYVNGAKVKTFTAVGNTNFPDGEEMAPVLVIKSTSTGEAIHCYLDWWICTQLRV